MKEDMDINTQILLTINNRAFTVNIPVDVPRNTKLLVYLRDYLKLTGAKDGCSQRSGSKGANLIRKEEIITSGIRLLCPKVEGSILRIVICA